MFHTKVGIEVLCFTQKVGNRGFMFHTKVIEVLCFTQR